MSVLYGTVCVCVCSSSFFNYFKENLHTSHFNTNLSSVFLLSFFSQAMPDSLKLSSDPDMHEWFLDRDSKIPHVILNDKLMTDAVFGGTLPIKSEHSYSLTSDGDSMPDSPGSLQNKMDGKSLFYFLSTYLHLLFINTYLVSSNTR